MIIFLCRDLFIYPESKQGMNSGIQDSVSSPAASRQMISGVRMTSPSSI
jgi:hypothetical protein